MIRPFNVFQPSLAQTQDTVLHTKALRARARAHRAAGQVGHAIKDYQRLVNEKHDEVHGSCRVGRSVV